MTDQEKKDLALSFRTMMDQAAWKHFEWILKRVEDQAVRDEDMMPISSMSLGDIGECRGRRNAIRKVRSDLDYILNGLK